MLFFLFVFPAFTGSAQITSPGLGDNTNTDTWMAVGFREKLDSSGTNQLMTYIGVGRESTRSDYNPLHVRGIGVLNAEYYHRFAPKWQGSLAVSYRRQHEYEHTEPYLPASPAVKQEFRLYGRISHGITVGHLKFTQTFRQEIRRFYTPGFDNWKVPAQLRTRLKLQAAYSFGNSGRHRIAAGAEVLFTTDRKAGKWTAFSYSETRLSGFYSYRLPVATISIGYMNDLLGSGNSFKDNHYVSVDVIFENLFGKMQKIKR